MEQKLRVGVITSTHGVRGEVKVFPTTTDKKRFSSLSEVYILYDRAELRLEIESVKFFKQFAILKFKGYDTIESIEKLKGSELLVSREDAVELDKDEYYIGDLIGMKVILEDDSDFGILKDVMETGANDVYIIEMKDGKEVLLPAIKECILQVNPENGTMKVHIMEGLLD